MGRYQLEKKDYVFAASAAAIVATVNILTFCVGLIGNLSTEFMLYPLTSIFIEPLIWGITVLIVTPFFKRLPAIWKLPTIRVVLWSPLVVLDVITRIQEKELISEYPIYLLYLNNEALLPLTNILLRLNESIDNVIFRTAYTYAILLVLFALIQVVILRTAKYFVFKFAR